MNLKESFRYQNYLSGLIDSVCSHLVCKSNVTKVTETHNRKKANPDAEDEVIDATLERSTDASIPDIVEFMIEVAKERRHVSEEIAKAKAASDFCLDAEVSNNRVLRQLSSTLSRMSMFKPSERVTQGRAYKFNAEGNQMPYSYDVTQRCEPEFNIAQTKKAAGIIAKEADDVSSQIDKFMIDTEVNVTPVFNVNERLDDAIASFVERKNADEDYKRAAV